MKKKYFFLLIGIFLVISIISSQTLLFPKNIGKNLKFDTKLKIAIQNATTFNNTDTIIPVLIEFDKELSGAEISDLTRLGLNFTYNNQNIMHAGKIYPAQASIETIKTLSESDSVKKIEYGVKEYVPA